MLQRASYGDLTSLYVSSVADGVTGHDTRTLSNRLEVSTLEGVNRSFLVPSFDKLYNW